MGPSVSDVSVKEAADRLGVSERRVQALIEAGRLPARRVGQSWLVPVEELSRVKYRSRPLSGRMAGALVGSLSGGSSGLAGSAEAQHRNRLGALLNDDDPASLLRSWLAAAVPPVRRFAAAPADLADLSADRRVVPGGISDPRSGIAAVDEFEGWIAARDLEALQREFLLVDAPRSNVLLHVSEDVVVDPLPLGWLLADLSASGGPREAAAVQRLLDECAESLAVERLPRMASRRSGNSVAQARAAQSHAAKANERAVRQAAMAAKARELAERQAAAAAKARARAERQAAMAARAQSLAERRAAAAARALAAAQRADGRASAAREAAKKADRLAAKAQRHDPLRVGVG